MKNLLLILFITVYSSAAAQNYLEIVKPDINIRLLPSTSEPIVGKAVMGEIYEVIGQNTKWYQVLLPSGEGRWIYKKLAILIKEEVSLSSEIDYSLISRKLTNVKVQAKKESKIISIANLEEFQIYKILLDRYSLIILQKNSIFPIFYKQILDFKLEEVNSARNDTTKQLVSVTHIDYDLFKIDSENYYLETRRCFKLGTALDAIILTYYNGDNFFQTLCFEDGYDTDFENCYNIKNVYESVINRTGLVALTTDGKIKNTDLILQKTVLNLPLSKY